MIDSDSDSWLVATTPSDSDTDFDSDSESDSIRTHGVTHLTLYCVVVACLLSLAQWP